MDSTRVDRGRLIRAIAQRTVFNKLSDKLTTKDDIREVAAAMAGPVIGSKVVCGKNGHCSQMRFVQDVLTCKVSNYALWASRTGSKTYLAGFMTWLLSGQNPYLETNILGGSESQSSKAYQAMTSFWVSLGDYVRQVRSGDSTITRTRWQNGSQAYISAASQRAVRGPHPQHLILDEVDEMDDSVYQAALSQPVSKNNITASVGIYSTYHNMSGTMASVVNTAQEGGLRLYKYCVWEVLESCRGYSCSTCKLSSICPGKAMKDADGYYKISDFVSKLSVLSWSTVRREWLCEIVGAGDLVYQDEWDSDRHVVHRGVDVNKQVYLSIDWGGTNPFSVGVWQNFDDIGWVRVAEVYEAGTTNQRLLAECERMDWWGRVVAGVADPSRPDLIAEWADRGVSLEKADNSVDEGIESVKGALAPVIGDPTIHIANTCIEYLREVESYKTKNGKVVQENDHTQDETRYFVMWKIKKSRSAYIGGGKESHPSRGGGYK